MNDKPKGKQGFASMDPAKRKEICSRGGKTAQANGKAHRFTSEEAAAAGRKGGATAHERGTAHKWTKEEAREVSKKGLEVRHSR